jgi:FAD/FMN-containing dehydrogenase
MKEDLIGILGKENVFDDEKTLRKYSSDQSFEIPQTADLVVFVQSVEQVQDVIKYANEKKIPVVPLSSGLNFHGAAVPKKGGILLNLSRMNRIIDIDEDNWFVVIEPGVTFSQLQDALEKKGLRAMIPFGAHPDRSALTSWVERDQALAAASFEYGNDLLMDTEIVLPDGELFKTGLWSAGGKPGSHMGPVRSMLYRFWSAAQGTLGIITKACFKVEHLPVDRKVYALQFESFKEVIEPLKAIQYSEIGLECFLLNHFNMASLFSLSWQVPNTFPAQQASSNEFESLRSRVPLWTLIICLNGALELGAEKIAYQEDALQKISSKMNLIPYNVTDKEDFLLKEMLRPWNILKKFCFRGSVQDLSFKTPLKRVPEFQKIIAEIAEKYDYPIEDIGGYVLPVERCRAVHCEFDFHYNPDNTAEKDRINRLWLETSEKLIEAGAFFDRPYGAWAGMMYSRTGEYTNKLKELKKEFDPNNILNPGHLCF